MFIYRVLLLKCIICYSQGVTLIMESIYMYINIVITYIALFHISAQTAWNTFWFFLSVLEAMPKTIITIITTLQRQRSRYFPAAFRRSETSILTMSFTVWFQVLKTRLGERGKFVLPFPRILYLIFFVLHALYFTQTLNFANKPEAISCWPNY